MMIVTAAPISDRPAFNWKPLEALPREGKFLVLNRNNVSKLITISTATLNVSMPAKLVADYLRDALCWDYFPDVMIEEDEGPQDGDDKRQIA